MKKFLKIFGIIIIACCILGFIFETLGIKPTDDKANRHIENTEVKKKIVKNYDDEYKNGIRKEISLILKEVSKEWENSGNTVGNFADGKINEQTALSEFKKQKKDFEIHRKKIGNLLTPEYFNNEQKDIYRHLNANITSYLIKIDSALQNGIETIEMHDAHQIKYMNKDIDGVKEYSFKIAEDLNKLDEAFKYKIEK